MTPRCSAQWTGGVPDGGPLRLPTRGEDGGAEAEHPAVIGGPGGDPSRGPSPRRTLTAAGDEENGMAESAAVHGKWDGNGCISPDPPH